MKMHKILLVEDNEMNRDMLSRRLKKRGFHIIVAVDAEKAVELGADAIIVSNHGGRQLDGAVAPLRALPAVAAAAGVAGLTKLILQLKHRQMPPSIHADPLNPNIDFERSSFYVVTQPGTWQRPVVTIHGQRRAYPLRAGLSSFGAGGANAHLILEEYAPDLELQSPAAADAYYWLGWVSYEKGDLESAKTQFRKVIVDFPESELCANALLKIADIFKQQNMTQEAYDALNTCIARFRGTDFEKTAYRKVGNLLTENFLFDRAVDYFRKALTRK